MLESKLTTGTARKSCLEPLRICDNVCGKILSCGHKCTRGCHGPEIECGPCNETRLDFCRCGRTRGTVLCSSKEPLLCDHTCTRMRNCGRHQCNTKCCPASGDDVPEELAMEAHMCPLICRKKLRGCQHTCELNCHRGYCPGCPYVSREALSCHCGRTIIPPPVPCGTTGPICNFPCTRPMPCGHPARPHSCHMEPGCPPCPVLVTKSCVCGKETRNNVPCHVANVSCGQPCGKPLKCGQHTCIRLCHSGPCVADDVEAKGCGQVCKKPRAACEHTCKAKCHPGIECNIADPVCNEFVVVRCTCGRRAGQQRCNTLIPLVKAGALLPDGRVQTEQGYYEQRTIRASVLACDNVCSDKKRQEDLANAFGKKIMYSDDLLAFARANTEFVVGIENRLRDFLANESQEVLQLQPMLGPKRLMVHKLCEVYGLLTFSDGAEPDRFCVVVKPAAPTTTATAVVASAEAPATDEAAAAAAAHDPLMHDFSGPKLSYGVPCVLLSTLAGSFINPPKYGKPYPGEESVSGIDANKVSLSGNNIGGITFHGAILFYDLNINISSRDIHLYLFQGHQFAQNPRGPLISHISSSYQNPAMTAFQKRYLLKWLDDCNALVLFLDAVEMARAVTFIRFLQMATERGAASAEMEDYIRANNIPMFRTKVLTGLLEPSRAKLGVAMKPSIQNSAMHQQVMMQHAMAQQQQQQQQGAASPAMPPPGEGPAKPVPNSWEDDVASPVVAAAPAAVGGAGSSASSSSQPAPKSSIRSSEIFAKLVILGNMGFKDAEQSRRALEECDGDIERAVTMLTANPTPNTTDNDN